MLGIDFGDRHIGLALNRGTGIAVPFKMIPYDELFWTILIQLARDERINRIVVGLPVSLSGKEHERALKTRSFVDELKRKVSIPVYLQDERLSSKAARAKGVKGHVDAAAAAEILQTYLDRYGKLRTSI